MLRNIVSFLAYVPDAMLVAHASREFGGTKPDTAIYRVQLETKLCAGILGAEGDRFSQVLQKLDDQLRQVSGHHSHIFTDSVHDKHVNEAFFRDASFGGLTVRCIGSSSEENFFECILMKPPQRDAFIKKASGTSLIGVIECAVDKVRTELDIRDAQKVLQQAQRDDERARSSQPASAM